MDIKGVILIASLLLIFSIKGNNERITQDSLETILNYQNKELILKKTQSFFNQGLYVKNPQLYRWFLDRLDKKLASYQEYSPHIYILKSKLLMLENNVNGALDTIYLAKRLFEKNNDSLGLGDFYQARASFYANNLNNKTAQLALDSAIQIYTSLNENYRMGLTYNIMGASFHRENSVNRAISCYLLSEKYFKKIGRPIELKLCYGNLFMAYKHKMTKEKLLNIYNDSTQIYYEKLRSIMIDSKLVIDYPFRYNEIDYLYRTNKKNLALSRSKEYLSEYLDKNEITGTGYNDFLKIKNKDEIGYIHNLAFRYANYLKNEDDFEQAIKYFSMAFQAQRAEKTFKSQQFSTLDESSFKKIRALEQHLKDVEHKNIQYILLGLALASIVFTLLLILNYKKANKLLEEQKAIVEKAQADVLDSINYAKSIQKATLPKEKLLKKHFTDIMVYNNPKDIVSGDFYWFSRKGDNMYIAVADCTGHGVPAGFLSMLSSRILTDLVSYKDIVTPAAILSEMHKEIVKVFGLENNKKRQWIEGVDIGICVINKKKFNLTFAGALRNLFVVDSGELSIIEGDYTSVGGLVSNKSINKSFIDHHINYENKCFYMGTDGMWDQFGEHSGRKLNTNAFKRLISENASLEMGEQAEMVTKFMSNWQGNLKQTDDQLFVGFQV